MLKKLACLTFCASIAINASFSPKAIAQITMDITEVASIQRQSDGRWTVLFIRNWVDGINANMMATTVKDFSCQTKLGTIINVQGNIGINAFNQPLNQRVNFYQEGDNYAEAIAPYCSR